MIERVPQIAEGVFGDARDASWDLRCEPNLLHILSGLGVWHDDADVWFIKGFDSNFEIIDVIPCCNHEFPRAVESIKHGKGTEEG